MKWKDVQVGDVINFSDDRGDGWNYTCLVLYPTTQERLKGFWVIRINHNGRKHIIYKDYFEALNTKLLARAGEE